MHKHINTMKKNLENPLKKQEVFLGNSLSTFNFQLSTHQGFTLVEVLVSISIFMIAIVAMVVVSAQGINNTAFAKNQLTASYLAQEGIELVRNARDNYIQNIQLFSDFSTDFGNYCINDLLNGGNFTGCTIDPMIVSGGAAILAATEHCINECPVLLYDQEGFYTYVSNTGVPTQYRRTITVDIIDAAQEVRVTSKVSWRQGQSTPSVSATENLFNWRTATP